MPNERRIILFSGHVQGVGFRMTAVQFAESFPLAGTVRNTDEGDVELVLEGESKDMDSLVNRLREHFGTFIRSTRQSPSVARGHLPHGVHIIH